MSGGRTAGREEDSSSVDQSSRRTSPDAPAQETGDCPHFTEIVKIGTVTYFEAVRGAGLDTVAGAFAYGGGEDLDKPNLGSRRRTRLTVTDAAGQDRELYLKRYGPRRWIDALRRRWTGASAGSPAEIEFDNVCAARAAGVATMQAVVAGSEGGRWGGGRSYIVVTAVPGEALERCGEAFLDRHGDDGAVAELTTNLAGLVRTLHQAGWVHRDLYASHVFLDESHGRQDLYLIDLARMFAPRRRQFRWRVKDLAQLKYSMPPAWVENYWDAFLADYLGADAGSQRQRYDRAVNRKVAAIRGHDQRNAARRREET